MLNPERMVSFDEPYDGTDCIVECALDESKHCEKHFTNDQLLALNALKLRIESPSFIQVMQQPPLIVKGQIIVPQGYNFFQWALHVLRNGLVEHFPAKIQKRALHFFLNWTSYEPK